MQERRTTVRIEQWQRTQYCSSDDLLPRDGRLINLSERGASLWTRAPHQPNERITLTFILPGEDDPLTATGLVRWSSEQPARRCWYPTGVEWLPLEDTVRYRVNSFLSRSAPTARDVGWPAIPRAMAGGRGEDIRWRPIAFIFGALLLIGMSVWGVRLQRQNEQLAWALNQRNTAIRTLEWRAILLQQDLDTAREHLAESAAALWYLDDAIRRLEDHTRYQEDQVQASQEAYIAVHEERDRLSDRVRTLEHEQAQLLWKLQLAVRQALDLRTRVQQDAQGGGWPLWWAGNRGYLVRDGHSTSARMGRRVHVYQPETAGLSLTP